MTNFERAILHSGAPNREATVAKQLRRAARKEWRVAMAKKCGVSAKAIARAFRGCGENELWISTNFTSESDWSLVVTSELPLAKELGVSLKAIAKQEIG